MTRILYQVTATLPSPAIAGQYLAWLEDGHVDLVIEHGAHSAMIVRLEPEPGDPEGATRVMTQYVFPTRARFDEYIAKHASALRADGLKLFGPDRGVRFERRIGTIV